MQNIEMLAENKWISCEQKSSRVSEAYEFHLHEAFEIYLFLQGSVDYFVEKTLYTLAPGDILLFNNNEIHRPIVTAQEIYERIVIHFDPVAAQELSTIDTPLLQCFLLREPGKGNLLRMQPEELAQLRRLTARMVTESGEKAYGNDVLLRAHLAELLVMLNAAAGRTKPETGEVRFTSAYVREALEYINAHLTEPLSLELLEKKLSVNRYYLSKIFRQDTGATIHNYILLKRLMLARVLLQEGCSVTECCAQSGFNDYSNFIRTFKTYTGATPAAFARKYRQ